MLDAAVDKNVLAYFRPGATRADSILVILNYGTKPALIPLGTNSLEALRGKSFVDLLTGNQVSLEEPRIEIAPGSVQVLKPI